MSSITLTLIVPILFLVVLLALRAALVKPRKHGHLGKIFLPVLPGKMNDKTQQANPQDDFACIFDEFCSEWETALQTDIRTEGNTIEEEYNAGLQAAREAVEKATAERDAALQEVQLALTADTELSALEANYISARDRRYALERGQISPYLDLREATYAKASAAYSRSAFASQFDSWWGRSGLSWLDRDILSAVADVGADCTGIARVACNPLYVADNCIQEEFLKAIEPIKQEHQQAHQHVYELWERASDAADASYTDLRTAHEEAQARLEAVEAEARKTEVELGQTRVQKIEKLLCAKLVPIKQKLATRVREIYAQAGQK